jgi:hypothetical protein
MLERSVECDAHSKLSLLGGVTIVCHSYGCFLACRVRIGMWDAFQTVFIIFCHKLAAFIFILFWHKLPVFILF